MDRRDRADPLTLEGRPITWEEAERLPPIDRGYVIATAPDGGRYRPFRFVSTPEDDEN